MKENNSLKDQIKNLQAELDDFKNTFFNNSLLEQVNIMNCNFMNANFLNITAKCNFDNCNL